MRPSTATVAVSHAVAIGLFAERFGIYFSRGPGIQGSPASKTPNGSEFPVDLKCQTATVAVPLTVSASPLELVTVTSFHDRPFLFIQ